MTMLNDKLHFVLISYLTGIYDDLKKDSLYEREHCMTGDWKSLVLRFAFGELRIGKAYLYY